MSVRFSVLLLALLLAVFLLLHRCWRGFILSIDDAATTSIPLSSQSLSFSAQHSKDQPPYVLSQELQAIVGTSVMTKPQVMDALWQYIRANALQDESDKRKIHCDAKLERLWQQPENDSHTVHMFALTSAINQHVIREMTKEEYKEYWLRQQETSHQSQT
jgi:chromatin remodeling complex protein RSC6